MDAATLKALVVGLLAWLNVHTGYDIPAQRPVVAFVPQQELVRMACTGPCPILAWSPTDSPHVIYLAHGLDPENNTCERAILVHELVHHLQEHAGAFAEYAPTTRNHMREMEALWIQKVYLHEHGRKLHYSGTLAIQGLTGPYC